MRKFVTGHLWLWPCIILLLCFAALALGQTRSGRSPGTFTATGGDATTLNGLTSSQFLRSDQQDESSAGIYVKYPYFDVKHSDFGAVGDGIADDQPAVVLAHIAATVSGGKIFFPQGTYKIGDDLTINSDVILDFSLGAKLSIDNTKIVTINGHIVDTMYQIFSGAGSVAGAPKNDFVRPEWWGAVSDGATDCQAAFELAINFAYNNGVGQVKLSAGIYYINSTTTFTNVREVTIVGTTTKPQYTSSRVSGSAIVFNGIATDTPGWKFVTCRGLSFENFWMYTVGTKAHSGIYLDRTATSVFKGIDVQRFTTSSVYIDDSFSLTFKDCTFAQSDAGIRSEGNCQNITFLGCWLTANTTCGAWVYGQNYTFIGNDFEGQPRGIDQESGVGRVNSRGWLIEGNYFEGMSDDEVIYLVFNDYSQLGTAFLSSLAYRIVLITSDHNVVVNWPGDIYLSIGSTDNTIVHAAGTVTDAGTDTIEVADIATLFADIVTLNNIILRKDGSVALTDNWSAGNYLLTVGDIGVTKTIASYGPELVTNGTFDVNTDGWTAVVATLSSEAGGESNNCLKNLSIGGGGAWLSQARQEVTVTPFIKHKLSFYFKKGDSTNGKLYIDDTAFSRDPTSGDLYYSYNMTDVAWTEYTAEFVPTTSTIYLMLENNDTGAHSLFDEVSIKAFKGGNLSVGNDLYVVNDVSIGEVLSVGGVDFPLDDFIYVSDIIPAKDGTNNDIVPSRQVDGTANRAFNRSTSNVATQDINWQAEFVLSELASGIATLKIFIRTSDKDNCVIAMTLEDQAGNADATGSVTFTPAANDIWEQFTYTVTGTYTSLEHIFPDIRIESLNKDETVDVALFHIEY